MRSSRGWHVSVSYISLFRTEECSFDGYIKIFDPLPDPPTLLRNFHASRLTPGEALIASTDEADASYFNVNQIILDNDFVVASIGSKVFGWRAGTGKSRLDGKGGERRRMIGGKGELGGNGRTIGASHCNALTYGNRYEGAPSRCVRLA